MLNNPKTRPALLYLLLLLGEASCNYFESELSLANDKTSIVRKCCPKERIRHHRRPLYCCQDGLFRDEEDGYLLKECADQGVSSVIILELFLKLILSLKDSIVKIIRCAQQEIHGEKAVEICKAYCCELFRDSHCSKICLTNITKVNMSIEILFELLKKCRNHENYGEVHDCIHSKRPKDMDAAELEIYCKKAINMAIKLTVLLDFVVILLWVYAKVQILGNARFRYIFAFVIGFLGKFWI
ncbi:unnamed protein product [Meloidogyne enterolobii]|uniref:Uncharacterized protein n=1 Tax=Meloidogyne enterolobii TaxID=390850 RepID=A0ACB1B7S8_MELEN